MNTRFFQRNVIFLILIFVVALSLRIYNINDFFGVTDDVTMPLYVLDSIPDNISLDNFFILNQGARGNPLRLLGFPLGALQPIILFFVILIYSVLGIPITEFSWTLPIILLGALTVFPVYKLVSKISNERSGLVAAALFAVIPIHTMQSRSLGSVWVIGFILQVLVILCLISFLEKKQTKYAFLFSILLALYIISNNQFLSIFPVLVYISFIYQSPKQSFMLKCKKALVLFLNWQLFILPLLTLLGLFALHIFFAYFRQADFSGVDTGVGSLSHIIQRETSLGFYFLQALKDVIANFGMPLLIWILIISSLNISHLVSIRKSSIFLIWGLSYLIPFIFLISPETTWTKAYISEGIYPFIMLASASLGYTCLSSKFMAKVVNFSFYCVLCFTLILNLSSTYRKTFLDWLYLPPFLGSVTNDNGAKTAGLWFRENTSPGSIIFTFNLSPKVCRYYSHRTCWGTIQAKSKEVLSYFRRIRKKVEYVIVSSKNPVNKILSSLEFSKVAVIKDGKVELQYIYSKKEPAPPIVLNVSKYNKEFNNRYSDLKSLTAIPQYVSLAKIKRNYTSDH